MAHIVQIPMSFDFRIRKVKWVEAEGRIVGTSTDWSGDPELKAEISANGKKIWADLKWDDLLLERGDQDDRYIRLVESDDWDSAARQIFSDLRPQFFIALDENSSAMRTLKDILNKDMFWMGTHSADAWRLRDAFLKIAPDEPNVLAFLNQWGRWTYADYTQLHRVLSFQKQIRRALLSPPDEWLSHFGSLLSPNTKSGYPNFAIHTDCCADAISATVTLDLLRKARFKTCSRTDCRQPFQITSRHKRKYCCQYCAHLESLRRSRASSLD